MPTLAETLALDPTWSETVITASSKCSPRSSARTRPSSYKITPQSESIALTATEAVQRRARVRITAWIKTQHAVAAQYVAKAQQAAPAASPP